MGLLWCRHRPGAIGAGLYTNLVRCILSVSFAMLPACGSPYMTFRISIYTKPLCAKFLRLYCWMISSGTNTIFFIPKGKVPAGITVTYGRIVAEIRPQKAEIHRTRLTVGGNLINFPGDVTTPTADLITVKLIFNSVLSTKNPKFMCADIANFYLNNPMNRYEYMKLPPEIIP